VACRDYYVGWHHGWGRICAGPLVMFGPVAGVVGARWWWWLLDKTAIATRSDMVMLVVRFEETATWDGVAALVGVLIFIGDFGCLGC
jgi:hypothetical protein